jgi:Histidine kinase-, DNA gyrase B-, and HSP90-like ATPase
MVKKSDDLINAEPTKTFFVDMLTRDIPLEQAILDLIDNCVDGAKSMESDGELPFEGREIKLVFSEASFQITDNCGGFSREAAINYAFKFGRPAGAKRTDHSIGQFGVGMKRALFKFGDHFIVRSATPQDEWAVAVNVQEWENEDGWHFPWAKFGSKGSINSNNPGTDIIVSMLRPEVGKRFGTKNFENEVISLIQSKHREFIAKGISISVNGTHLSATSLKLLEAAGLSPGVQLLSFDEKSESPINVRIIVAVAESSPRQAGWYVVCNGRVIIEADRTKKTAWGILEQEGNKLLTPSYHNQYARFRGVVYFDSSDSSKVPWNTTKTDIDQDSPAWQSVFLVMIDMMRPVVTFLNELDDDIDNHPKNESPLLQFVNKAMTIAPENLNVTKSFAGPSRESVRKGPKTVKIQYSRRHDDVEFMKEELEARSARAVGEKTFDLALKRLKG